MYLPAADRSSATISGHHDGHMLIAGCPRDQYVIMTSLVDFI